MAVTRLGLYGGARVPYQSFFAEVIEIEGGGSTLKEKLSRKEKKRKKKQEQSEKIRIALLEQAERRRRQAEQDDNIAPIQPIVDVPPASKPKKQPPDIEPRPFVPDTRLAEGLLVPGESSGFIRQAIEREQAVKAEQERIEQKRLEILADDEAVIALYLAGTGVN